MKQIAANKQAASDAHLKLKVRAWRASVTSDLGKEVNISWEKGCATDKGRIYGPQGHLAGLSR